MQACNTYKAFYSETALTTNQEDAKNVYRLDLSNQNLEEIPESISKLTNLKMLDLSGNPSLDLNVVFNKISQPEKLEVLILDNLSLKSLPDNIYFFENLKHLSLNRNPLISWTEAFKKIGVLPLKFLNIQENNLTVLPQEILELQTLKDLNLSYNNFANGKTYKHLAKLPKLYSLWLSYNGLKKLPAEIGLLHQVKNLYIGHNELTELPLEMQNMKAVWVVQAEHNLFAEVPEVFIEMSSLFSVHLNNCEIIKISEAFATEKYTMKGLLLDNNKMSESSKKRWKKEFKNFFLLSME